jgi:hypothetical protein
MNAGIYQRTKPRLNVLRGYNGNQTRGLTYSAVPKSGEAILSGMLISLDSNNQWVKGVAAGKTPYFAWQDQSDTDVLSSGKLTGLSCAGDYELETGYYVTGSYVQDSPLIAGTSGNAGSVDLGAALASITVDIIGFASGSPNGSTGTPLIDISRTNSESTATTVLRLVTRWMPARHA